MCVKNSDSLWKTKLPLKIKVFLWQLSHNKLQKAVALKRRGWKGDLHCCLCNRPETTNHIFCSCFLARLVWIGLGQAFGWGTIPKSWMICRGSDLLISSKQICALALSCLQVLPGLYGKPVTKWRSKKPSRTSRWVQFMLVFLLYRKWRRLLKPTDQEKIAKRVETLKTWLNNYSPVPETL